MYVLVPTFSSASMVVRVRFLVEKLSGFLDSIARGGNLVLFQR